MSQSWEQWKGIDSLPEGEKSAVVVAEENAMNTDFREAVLCTDEVPAGMQRPLGYAIGQNALRNLVGDGV